MNRDVGDYRNRIDVKHLQLGSGAVPPKLGDLQALFCCIVRLIRDKNDLNAFFHLLYLDASNRLCRSWSRVDQDRVM